MPTLDDFKEARRLLAEAEMHGDDCELWMWIPDCGPLLLSDERVQDYLRAMLRFH